jgi:hypothetical protein
MAISGYVAAALFAAGVLVAMSYPVNSKNTVVDPPPGITSVHFGLWSHPFGKIEGGIRTRPLWLARICGGEAKSGLGIEAQRQAVATYLNGGNWRIIAEFTEIESGKRSDRPALDKALAAARVHQVPLVVAKVDRLTRSVAFLSRLLEAGRTDGETGDLDPPRIPLEL